MPSPAPPSATTLTTSTTRARQLEYVAAREATATCADENGNDVSTEVECEYACSVISGATRYKRGRWNHAVGCFIVVSGRWAGGCHWNRNTAAGSNNQDTRSVCAKQATVEAARVIPAPSTELSYADDDANHEEHAAQS